MSHREELSKSLRRVCKEIECQNLAKAFYDENYPRALALEVAISWKVSQINKLEHECVARNLQFPTIEADESVSEKQVREKKKALKINNYNCKISSAKRRPANVSSQTEAIISSMDVAAMIATHERLVVVRDELVTNNRIVAHKFYDRPLSLLKRIIRRRTLHWIKLKNIIQASSDSIHIPEFKGNYVNTNRDPRRKPRQQTSNLKQV
jgi:hypothetical protein